MPKNWMSKFFMSCKFSMKFFLPSGASGQRPIMWVFWRLKVTRRQRCRNGQGYFYLTKRVAQGAKLRMQLNIDCIVYRHRIMVSKKASA